MKRLASVLLGPIFVIVSLHGIVASRESADEVLEEEHISLVFLGRPLDFYLDQDFSAHKIATEFCEREALNDEEDAASRGESPDNQRSSAHADLIAIVRGGHYGRRRTASLS